MNKAHRLPISLRRSTLLRHAEQIDGYFAQLGSDIAISCTILQYDIIASDQRCVPLRTILLGFSHCNDKLSSLLEKCLRTSIFICLANLFASEMVNGISSSALKSCCVISLPVKRRLSLCDNPRVAQYKN